MYLLPKKAGEYISSSAKRFNLLKKTREVYDAVAEKLATSK